MINTAEPGSQRHTLVEFWILNSEETIRILWEEYHQNESDLVGREIESEPHKDLTAEDIEKIRGYVVDRCVVENLTSDFIVMMNGRVDIDSDLVHEAFEVLEYV